MTTGAERGIAGAAPGCQSLREAAKAPDGDFVHVEVEVTHGNIVLTATTRAERQELVPGDEQGRAAVLIATGRCEPGARRRGACPGPCATRAGTAAAGSSRVDTAGAAR